MKKLIAIMALAGLTSSLSAQTPATKDANEPNVFTTVKDARITSIKNQANSGTCWAYSGQSFLEDELIRTGKGDYDLSEMFVVSHSYRDKGRKYVRLHGKLNFAQGGSFYDVLYVLKNYGAVPRSVLPGLNYGTTKNQHGEMEAGLKAFLDAIITNPNGKLSTAWYPAFESIIDQYLGKLPEEFTFKGKKYTPKSYGQALGLNADDYISLTSFTHHPFYSKFALEIEDNWRWAESYNLPIDELMRTMEYAIDKGYTIAWGSDVSEQGFTRDGIAVLADVEEIETKGSDQARWVGLNRGERQTLLQKLIRSANVPEIDPTQEYRQKGYDNFELTDDHGMVIYGIAKNQIGRKFFMVKNSWGETGEYKGHWYASYNFVKGKTMNIVLHRSAIPEDIAKKLGIKTK
mgnify:FL=1